MDFLNDHATYIIAEAGVNHNGDYEKARQLVESAAHAGADAVKFQMFEPKALASRHTPLANYQNAASSSSPLKNQVDLLSELSLPRDAFVELQRYCEQLGIRFLCTPFDEESARYLHQEMYLPVLKISSGEVTNLPYLRMLSALGVPVILSTGMSTLAEVKAAVEALRDSNPAYPALLHCVSSYPSPSESVNLRAMQTLQETFPECVIGYSDHTLGIHIPVAAVAMGARIIEKHFTLDKSLPGPDHKASLDVAELTEMVRLIRDVEVALGDGVKRPHPVEQDCIRVARKSLVARHDLPARHRLTLEDLCAKRPGTGISPAQLQQVLGKSLKQPLCEDELLQPEYLER